MTHTVKLGKITWEFVWHQHENEDELFLVVRENCSSNYATVICGWTKGEFCHHPEGCGTLPCCGERSSCFAARAKVTRNTGDLQNERTVDAQWI